MAGGVLPVIKHMPGHGRAFADSHHELPTVHADFDTLDAWDFAPFRAHRYSRLNQGFFLDSLFFQPRFFINDPWAYRLPPVYGPYQWVRYYDDVVLVDIYTGEVVDVIHDFFW